MASQVFSPHGALIRLLIGLLTLFICISLISIAHTFLHPDFGGIHAGSFFLPLLLAPVELILLWSIRVVRIISIEVTPDHIRFHTPRGLILMYWGEVLHFHFDTRRWTKSSRSGIEVYEVADGLHPIRFFEMARDCSDVDNRDSECLFPDRAMRLREAGIPLTRVQCRELVDAIRRYAGLVPVHKEGMF
jgi:hypothetical protein